MTINIMNEYIAITKKQIKEYLEIVLNDGFNQTYCDRFIEIYCNIRYLNYYENEFSETMRKKILLHLKQTGEDLIINNIQDREIIENMRVFFYYVLYFDNVTYYKDLRNKIIQIEKMRKKVFKQENYGFENILYKKMIYYMTEKENLIKTFISDKFYLKLTHYPNKLKVYRTNLKFRDIKFPLEYSDFAINKAFCMGLINEDKLEIEYYLVVLQILSDVLKMNFSKKYILEFAETLLGKPKKIKRFLNIIDNQAVQEKVSIKIRYEQFLKYEEIVYQLMREGFKITIILDNSFEPDYKNIERLKMFEYIIISSNLKCYEEIMENKEELHNIIEI